VEGGAAPSLKEFLAQLGLDAYQEPLMAYVGEELEGLLKHVRPETLAQLEACGLRRGECRRLISGVSLLQPDLQPHRVPTQIKTAEEVAGGCIAESGVQVGDTVRVQGMQGVVDSVTESVHTTPMACVRFEDPGTLNSASYVWHNALSLEILARKPQLQELQVGPPGECSSNEHTLSVGQKVGDEKQSVCKQALDDAQVSVWGYKVGDMVSVDGTTNKAVVQSFNAELVCIKYLDGGYVWVAAESLHLVTET